MCPWTSRRSPLPRGMPATTRAAKRAHGASSTELESLAHWEQGADCARAGVPALRIGSFVFFLHATPYAPIPRSEEHTSELQSHLNLVCRLLLEKKNNPPARVPTARQLNPPAANARPS